MLVFCNIPHEEMIHVKVILNCHYNQYVPFTLDVNFLQLVSCTHTHFGFSMNLHIHCFILVTVNLLLEGMAGFFF